MIDTFDKYKGALLGLAIGDALGTTLEFKDRGTFPPLTDMIGGGPFNLPVGYWTDDTSMALCLAQSIIDKQAIDPFDQMLKYYEWYTKGYMSSTGSCFDIGNTTKDAILNFHVTGQPISGRTAMNSAGNGSIMRLCPVPMFFRNSPREAIIKSVISSKTTHGAPQSVASCRYLTYLIILALNGASKEEILGNCYSDSIWEEESLDVNIAHIITGNYKSKEENEIYSSGYVVHTLEAALWAFYNSDSFEEGALKAVNLGDDADTTGAVYGQLAGAFYGADAIPSNWLEKIHKKDLIEDISLQLFELSNKLDQ
jgi:ADP-ribosylglycohydrolase